MPAAQATTQYTDKEAANYELWGCSKQMVLQARSASAARYKENAMIITTLPCQHCVHRTEFDQEDGVCILQICRPVPGCLCCNPYNALTLCSELC